MIINCYGNENSTNILIQMVDDHDLEVIESEVATIEAVTTDYYLITVKVNNWNHDLSPWKADAVFGNEDFTGGASETLQKILELCSDKSKHYYIGGYSLSGLFALWVAYQTDVFEGVAAASPSVWFPGFIEYMRDTHIKCNKVYLSLGDKESKTRNPIMATVADKIREAYNILKASGVDSILEWNQGNHFKEPGIRTGKAFAWLLRNIFMEDI